MQADEARRFAGATVLGIRPEYVTLGDAASPGAVPGLVKQVQDIGTYWLLAVQVEGMEAPVRARLSTNGGRRAVPAPGDAVWLVLAGPHTCFYKDDRLIPRDARDADGARIVQEVSSS
jgi:glycerol transport system ATP-binding protein